MKKYILYGHGGAYNHGSEAIVRTAAALIRRKESDAFIVLSSNFPAQDIEFGLDKTVDKIVGADLSLIPKERTVEGFENKELVDAEMFRDAIAEIDDNTVCVGVGGDNYCYPNWHRQSVFHRTAKKRGSRSILLGCSVQPDMIDEKMAEIMRGHDHVYARESITADVLKSHGVLNITWFPDTAFGLQPEEIPLPENFSEHCAALNISPLILRRTEGIMESFIVTAKLLLEHAETLMFIHHVAAPADNDNEALKELYENLTFEERKRICFAPQNANAAQLKYLISKCEMLVCCRTHASVAGYSSCVPTLVVGYSVKSQGIGKDLGMSKWVLPMDNDEYLPELALEMWNCRSEIRKDLAYVMPQVIAGANGANFLQDVL